MDEDRKVVGGVEGLPGAVEPTVEFWGFDWRTHKEVCHRSGVRRPTFLFDLSEGDAVRLAYGEYEEVLLKFKQMMALITYAQSNPAAYMKELGAAGVSVFGDLHGLTASLSTLPKGWTLVEVVPSQPVVSALFQSSIRSAQVLARLHGHQDPPGIGFALHLEPIKTYITSEELDLHVTWDKV